MDQKIVKEWVSELRSDNYIQGMNKLKAAASEESPAAHCCLGVLCDMAVKAGVVTTEYSASDETWFFKGEGALPVSSLPPESVEKWLFGEDEIPDEFDWEVGDREHTLYVMNDNGASFKDIADVIEANYLDEEK